MTEKLTISKVAESSKNTACSPEAKIESRVLLQSPYQQVMHLQQAIGNRAVQRLFKSGRLQAALKIGTPDGVYEQEAERVADEVMRAPETVVQKTCDQCAAGVPPCSNCAAKNEKMNIRRKADAAALDSAVPDNCVSSLGTGQSLDRATRNYFEPRFGADFSHVKVHSGAQAAESAGSINARAYTLGSNMVFGAGQYEPNTIEGKRLLAHELTHVIQQNQRADVSGGIIQASFEDEPISAGHNADTLVTRIQGILREWKSECQEGVNDFVHAELAASIDALGSGSWPNFLVALIGNTIWAATAFVPVVGTALSAAQVARVTFALSMAGIAINAAPSVPAASSDGANLLRISLLLKNYYGDVFTGLFNQINPLVTQYVANHPTQTGNQALIAFLINNFQAGAINISSTPNINGNYVRLSTQRKAADLLNRYRQQILPIGPATTVNVTDPVDRQVTTQTGIVWAQHANGTSYLTRVHIENSAIGGRQRGARISFRGFIDNDLRQSAIDRATPNQPRGIQTMPWAMISYIPENAPASVARQ